MNIDPGTKVMEIVDKYPQIVDYIPQVKDGLEMLKNPLAKLIAKNMTISGLKEKAGLDENKIIDTVKDAISQIEAKKK